MSWEVDAASAKRVKDIADALKDADGLILATDPDREGEAISWHVLDLLKKKKVLGSKPVKRVVFNAITKKAVLDAMAQPRDIDIPWWTPISPARAGLSRRLQSVAVLWRKLPAHGLPGRAVGGVASRLRSRVRDRALRLGRILEPVRTPENAAR